MHKMTLRYKHREAQRETHKYTDRNTHTPAHLAQTHMCKHLRPPWAQAPDSPINAHMVLAHGHIRAQDPCTSGSQSRAYGTLNVMCHLTCICPMAAGSPETKQPQARSPRCPHPGPERSATAAAPEITETRKLDS